ncbi:MAG TPA: DUF2892 domain-containing protein [Gemmatimonadales bacterium]|nr:DUF2892 domain-containing protein [Gemmatimonadales bacterium]
MTTNVGRIDAAVRWLLAAVLFGIAIVFQDLVVLTVVAALLAMVLAGTAATRTCPLYAVLGLRTQPKHHRPEARPGSAH